MVKSIAVAENGKWWDLIFDDGILTIETLSSPKIPVLTWRTFGTPNSVNKQELVSPNDQADPQPGQRPPSNAETAQTTSDAKTETPTAVRSSDWLD